MWFVAALLALTLALHTLRSHAHPDTPIHVHALVALSWTLGFFLFLVLPFDLEHAYCERCKARASAPHASASLDATLCRCLPAPAIELLPTLIPVAYKVTLLLGYLMNDLLRSYIASGEFTPRGRARDALRDFAMFYVPFGLIGVAGLVWLIIGNGLSGAAVLALLQGLFNIIGLFLLVAFLGYGLVEVPRNLWHKGNIEGQLRYYQFKVATISEALQEASRRLDETLQMVHATEADLRQASSAGARQLEAHMAQLLARCPMSAGAGGSTSDRPMAPAVEPRSSTRGRSSLGGGLSRTAAASPQGVFFAEATLESNHRALVALHVRLRDALHGEASARGQYEMYVRRSIRQSERVRRFRPDGTDGGGGGGGGGGAAAAAWRPLLQSAFYRGVASVCAALTLVVIWCEGTVMLTGRPISINASPLSWILYGFHTGAVDPPQDDGSTAGGGGLGNLLFVYTVVLYTAACTYHAMFRNCIYPLLPHKRTDANALLFNATYACRLGPPLCFNFLKLIHESDYSGAYPTYFQRSRFGGLDKIKLEEGSLPFRVGDYFSDYAPLIVVIVFGCTALNLGSQLLGCCGTCLPCFRVPTFSFDEDFSDGYIDKGVQLVERERRSLADGASLGSALPPVEADSDREDAGASRRAPAAQRKWDAMDRL